MGMEHVNRIWKELKLDKKVRAEDITVDQWFKIASFVTL
jgi:16S rRNA A1518/A1519 N6-dimethyltransferase RsmA/KsgA/DIM1 with predicted DNA glycosylase/AP lyase activity